MRRHRSVITRIWLSISAFAAGYVLSVVLGQIQSLDMERHLSRTAEALFPAAQKAQTAEAGYQRIHKMYQDAVMTEDAARLDEARTEGAKVLAILRQIPRLEGLPAERARSAGQLASQLEAALANSDAAYRLAVAAGANLNGDLANRLHECSRQNEGIQAEMARLVNESSSQLKGELALTATNSARHRAISLIVFLVAFAVAGLLVNVTIQRAIRQPLDQVTRRLAESSDSIAAATAQLSTSSQTLARNAANEAATLQQIAASSEEVSSMARRNAEGASHASELMRLAGENDQAMTAAHAQLVEAMNRIAESSGKIDRIIRVIDEIAFQTNILALNAAVEAARAGESGMGFAVVADEVRNLAHRSAQAARDTSSLIEDSVAKSAAGGERLTVVTALMEKNRELAAKVTRLIADISTASAEQVRGMEQVSKTVTQVSHGTQDTAAHAQQSAAHVSQLGSEAHGLKDVVASVEKIVGR
jgi:methyl-accepting chemotaxis protein/methyl-accepting chemotaxis protein-1 (serine sensor receptor)